MLFYCIYSSRHFWSISFHLCLLRVYLIWLLGPIPFSKRNWIVGDLMLGPFTMQIFSFLLLATFLSMVWLSTVSTRDTGSLCKASLWGTSLLSCPALASSWRCSSWCPRKYYSTCPSSKLRMYIHIDLPKVATSCTSFFCLKSFELESHTFNLLGILDSVTNHMNLDYC